MPIMSVNFSFKLSSEFVDSYRAKPEPFGFNGLGATVFYRTYSRKTDEGVYESWVDVCERVINGMYTIQKDHCTLYDRPWSDEKARLSAEEAFDRLFNLKWSPSGRGLWMLGTEFFHERKSAEAGMNCAFISTNDLDVAKGSIFSWFMEMLMLGVGVGGDVKGAGKVHIRKPSDLYADVYQIPDSREGWADSVEMLFNTYIDNHDGIAKDAIEFDYSLIRPAGSPIKGFGGVAEGPEPLIKLHERMRKVLDANTGNPITVTTIADIFNQIGACVIAGNVRRSAEILLGDINDNDEFLTLKSSKFAEQRGEWSWASNNSVLANTGDYYGFVSENILNNGEPGIVWEDNISKYGRMGELKPDNAIGVNPCGEQPLANREMCNLVEVYLNNHNSEYDYQRTLKFAYLYGKTISLTYDWIADPISRDIMMKNRRVGLSNTGVAQFVTDNGMGQLIEWLDNGYNLVKQYDNRYSAWLAVPKSIRLTTSKPSGTVSLLAGATPGVHYPRSEYYIRRVRIASSSPMVFVLGEAGFYIEPDKYSDNTVVVEFPIHVGDYIPSVLDLSIWEQLAVAAIVQKYWADNSVSVTVSFDPKKVNEDEIFRALEIYQYQLKSVSLLPEYEEGTYEQMPYEEITVDEYYNKTKDIDWGMLGQLRDAMSSSAKLIEKFCDGEACEIGV